MGFERVVNQMGPFHVAGRVETLNARELFRRSNTLIRQIRRVIEETVRETLPEDFQTAEYLKEHGIVDMVVERTELHDTIGRILNLLMDTQQAA